MSDLGGWPVQALGGRDVNDFGIWRQLRIQKV